MFLRSCESRGDFEIFNSGAGVAEFSVAPAVSVVPPEVAEDEVAAAVLFPIPNCPESQVWAAVLRAPLMSFTSFSPFAEVAWPAAGAGLLVFEASLAFGASDAAGVAAALVPFSAAADEMCTLT